MDHNSSGLPLWNLPSLVGKAMFGLIISVSLLIIVAPTVIACSCARLFAGSHPCSSYWSSDIVFTGQVSEIERRQTNNDNGTVGNRHVVTHFLVDEAFRGVSGKAIEIYTGAGGGDCGYSFKQGERYIIYGRRNPQDGQIWTGICSATKPLADAAPDLEYARAVKRGETGGIIFGSVARYERANAQSRGNHKMLARIPVIVEGQGQSYNVLTGQDGIFQVGGLPDGTYRVRIELPADLPPLPPQEAVIGKMRCAAVEFFTNSLATLGGRLLDPEGAPLKGTPVHLVPAEENSETERNGGLELAGYTDQDGKFAISQIPAGRYLLVLNPHGHPDKDDPPYPRTYFPRTTERAAAKVFRISEGEQIEVEDFRLLTRLVPHTITGRVEWPDGSPAVNVLVMIEHPEKPEGMDFLTTDKNGRFEVNGYVGARYRVLAEHRSDKNAKHAKPVELVITGASEPLKLTITQDGLTPLKRPKR
jgi:hypothetical protein